MLVRAVGARSVVEFGTSFGVSTLHLAAGLRDNGGGRIITTEFEPSKAARAQENFAVGGLADLIELREGDALQTLARDLPGQIDGFTAWCAIRLLGIAGVCGVSAPGT
jgi:predicted O-methyltransferase YrrM